MLRLYCVGICTQPNVPIEICIYISLCFERNEIFYRSTRHLCTVAKINSLGDWIDRSFSRRKQLNGLW
jgi:hypothetical protein